MTVFICQFVFCIFYYLEIEMADGHKTMSKKLIIHLNVMVLF